MVPMVDNFLYYLKVFSIVIYNSLIKELTFRFNITIRIMTDITWYLVNILFFQVIYLNSNTILGWNLGEVMLFLGTMFIIDSLHMSFFYFNTLQIPYYIRTGLLDSFLIKPINTRFLISIRNINFSSLFNAAFGIFVVSLSIQELDLTLNFFYITIYILFIINGVLIMYSILFIGATLSIYFSRTEGLMNTFFEIFQFGMKPDIIYEGTVKFVMTYIIPVLVIVNFPTKILLNKLSIINSLWGFGISILLLIISHVFWKISLKKYTSATS